MDLTGFYDIDMHSFNSLDARDLAEIRRVSRGSKNNVDRYVSEQLTQVNNPYALKEVGSGICIGNIASYQNYQPAEILRLWAVGRLCRMTEDVLRN